MASSSPAQPPQLQRFPPHLCRKDLTLFWANQTATEEHKKRRCLHLHQLCGLGEPHFGCAAILKGHASKRQHTYIHAYIHTYTRTYTYTYIRTSIPTYMHTYLHTYIHTYIPTYLHTYIHTYIHTYSPTYTQTSSVNRFVD